MLENRSSGQAPFRTWRPLLEGDDAARALAAVDVIAGALAALPLPAVKDAERAQHGEHASPSLAGGHAGYAVFFAYLNQHRPGEGFGDRALAHLDLAIELLASAETIPDFYPGFTGVAWAVDHVQDLLPPEPDPNGDGDLNAEIDEALCEHLDQAPWIRSFDLISGLAGYGVYALSRLPRPRAVKCLELVVDRLEELAVERPHGVAWHTAPEHLWPTNRETFPDGYDNLGVAHGVPGVVAVLAQVSAAGVAPARVRPLVDGAVRWMLAQRLEPRGESVFPYHVSAVPPKPARAAWCYGDPGIAGALLVAARALGEPTWEREALELARFSARRSPATTGVKDAGLCHGSAGLGHLLNACYQATGEELLRDAAHFWLREALEQREAGQGFGGFTAWDANADGEMEWLATPGFLTGATGVGLALLAAATSFDPRWDEVLLVSPVSPGSDRQAPGGSAEEAGADPSVLESSYASGKG